MQVLFSAGWSLEILLTLERYCSLYRKEFFIQRIRVKYLTIGILLFFIALAIPDYFAIEIKYSGQPETYLISLTDIGTSKWYSIYIVIVLVSGFLTLSVVLIVLNAIVIKALHVEIKRRRQIVADGQIVVYKKINLTKIIICVNTYFILVRGIHLAMLIIYRIDYLNGIFYSPINNLLREFNYLFLTISYCVSIFVYAYFDKAFRTKIKEHFIPLPAY